MKHFFFFQIFTVYMFSFLRFGLFLYFFFSLKPWTVISSDKAKGKSRYNVYEQTRKCYHAFFSLSFCMFLEKKKKPYYLSGKKSPEKNGESDLGVCVLCSSSQIMSLFMYVCVFSLCVFSTTSKRLDVVLLFCFFLLS
jgi:hypothetical protein